GLANFDQVAVRVAHVAPDLSTAIDRRRHELGPFYTPLLIALLNVNNPQIQETRDRVAGLVVDDRDVRLVGGRPTAWVHDQPRVRELDHARVLLQHDLAAEDFGVERAGPSDASYGDEVRD